MQRSQLLNEQVYAAAAQAGFGCPRGIWGEVIGYSMAWTHRLRNAWILTLLDVKPDDRVLEIGCGPGAAIHDIATTVTRGFVAGVDPSEVMVRQATRRNAAYIREGRVALYRASMSAIPCPDGRFDKVFGINSIQFSRALRSDLREARRILRPAGLAAFSVQPLWKGGTDAAAVEIGGNLMDAMAECGFGNCRLKQKRTWPRLTVCAMGQRS
jgi:ubiquinone/menaquinone biosynthesis C-methylase UbiE